MSGQTLNSLVESASNRLRQWCGRDPQWVVTAPGRVNLIGEHIDYNGGFVLPMAIERYCVIAAHVATGGSPAAAASAHVFSASADEETTISLANPARNTTTGHWSNYIAGVISGCAARKLQPSGFNAVIESSVPVGGGLSSSAAIEVATATLIEAMTGTTLDPVDKALLCQQAEHEYAGVPCGIMDQFASAMCRADHLMLLDCRSRQFEHIAFTNPDVTVLIINTNVKHELSGGEYAERRAQCESASRKLGVAALRDATMAQLQAHRNELSDPEFRRARHAISEIARTRDAAAAIRACDWPRLGQLMYASHDSLRDDYEVSCRELDLLVDRARKIGLSGGVIGSRMTGGGFGGCTVSLVETAKIGRVAPELAQTYRTETGIELALLTSRPARGAQVILATE
jgi:galactokinase